MYMNYHELSSCFVRLQRFTVNLGHIDMFEPSKTVELIQQPGNWKLDIILSSSNSTADRKQP